MTIEQIKPAGNSWVDIVSEHARIAPDRPVMGLGDHVLTYGQLPQIVDQAVALLKRLGVKRGDRVALLAPPRPEAIITFLACTKLGAIWLALNPKYKAPEIDYILSHAQPALLMSVEAFDGERYVETVNEVVGQIKQSSGQEIATVFFSRKQPTHDALFAALAEAPAAGERDPALTAAQEDACMLVYTSGSTGRPKGVLLPEFASIFRATIC